MPKFIVTVSRTASEMVEFSVKAESQDAAERKIGEALDTTQRINVFDLAALEGVTVVSHDYVGDEESTWEVV